MGCPVSSRGSLNYLGMRCKATETQGSECFGYLLNLRHKIPISVEPHFCLVWKISQVLGSEKLLSFS